MTYQVINTIVAQSDAELTAAEAHGMATGMLCVNEHAESGQWLTELFRHATPVIGENKTSLVRLFDETQRLLASDEFEFDLFLPEDDVLLREQVEALSHWCQGFLLGVGFANSSPAWSKEVIEILKDIAEFTKLDAEVEGEEDENDFTEITEYLRSAVLLLRDELSSNTGDTIH
jgi:uncharacterized protein YgfB (UPF0149 family)